MMKYKRGRWENKRFLEGFLVVGLQDRGTSTSPWMSLGQQLVSGLRPEPEFLNTLKFNLAESASTGFLFNCYDNFNDKTPN